MLLRVALTAARPAEGGRKRKRHDKVQPGSVVEGSVLRAHPLCVDVQLADGGALLQLFRSHSNMGASHTQGGS